MVMQHVNTGDLVVMKTKYRQIASSLTRQILAGNIQPGEKIPSVRVSCELHGVSMTTVQAAYLLLEGEGLIFGKAGAGYYVSDFSQIDLHELTEPVGLSVHNRVLEVLSQCHKEGVYNLGTAVIDPKLLPINQLRSVLNKLCRYHMEELVSAEFSSGFQPLRRQFAKKMLNASIHAHPDEILITGGCQDAISLALSAIAKPGDIIAVESPCFPGLLQIIEALNMKALEIPTSLRSGMDINALKEALTQWTVSAVVLVPSFSNPTGSLMPIEARRALVEFSASMKLPLIEDDLFSELNFSGKPKPSLKSMDKAGYVIYCSSVSKSLGSGFRLGWLSGGRFHKEIIKLKAFRNVSEPLVIQMLITEFLKSGGYERHLKRLKSKLIDNYRKMSECIKLHFPKGTMINTVQGGYLVWIKLPPDCDSRVLFKQAILKSVAFFPGDLFSQHGHYINYIRLNLAICWSEHVEQAIIVLGNIVSRMVRSESLS